MDTPSEGAQRLIREALGAHCKKRLARLLNCPVETAKSYLYKRLSKSRLREIATKILEDMDREDRERATAELRRADIRKALKRMSGDDIA